MKNKPSSQNIGNAGEYFIASILSSHNFIATITLGRAEKYDIIAVSEKGKVVKIQVKTMWKKTKRWVLTKKHEKIVAPDYFYAFVSMNEGKEPPEFWVIPSKIVALFLKKTHKSWLKIPGKNGRPHRDSPMRNFSVVKDFPWFPKEISLDEINKGYNSLEPILQFEKNIKKVMKRPFEGCVEIGKNKYTGEGFFDDSQQDDRKFRRIIKKLKKEKNKK